MKAFVALLVFFVFDIVSSHYNYLERDRIQDEKQREERQKELLIEGHSNHHENRFEVHHESTVTPQNFNFTFKFHTSSPKCIELNQRRDDLRDCCDYPHIRVFRDFSVHCIDECVGSKDFCCTVMCMWRSTKVKFDDGKINLEGLKNTLLKTVRHKEDWEDIVNRVVDQCDSEGKILKSFFEEFVFSAKSKQLFT